MNDITLLACPFCGATARFMAASGSADGQPVAYFGVVCTVCPAYILMDFADEQQAAAAWNRRASDLGNITIENVEPMEF